MGLSMWVLPVTFSNVFMGIETISQKDSPRNMVSICSFTSRNVMNVKAPFDVRNRLKNGKDAGS